MKWRPDDNALLAAMPADVRATLAQGLTLMEMKQGEVVFEPDAPIACAFFPVTGVLSMLTVLRDGSAVETATVGREGAVGLGSAFTDIRSHGRTIAQTPTTLFRVDKQLVQDVAAKSSALRELIVAYADLMLAQAQQSTACNISHDVEERFCRWLLTCDDRVRGARVELTQEFLAMMLGVQRTTVSQVASQIQAAGLIRYNRGRIDILNRPELEARSCECYEAVRRRTREFMPPPMDVLTPTTREQSAKLG